MTTNSVVVNYRIEASCCAPAPHKTWRPLEIVRSNTEAAIMDTRDIPDRVNHLQCNSGMTKTGFPYESLLDPASVNVIQATVTYPSGPKIIRF